MSSIAAFARTVIISTLLVISDTEAAHLGALFCIVLLIDSSESIVASNATIERSRFGNTFDRTS